MNTILAILPAFALSSDSNPERFTDTAFIRASRTDFVAERYAVRKIPGNTGLNSATALLTGAGIHIKQYGQTGLATLTLRGADPQQMQVLWNGIPISNPMAGMMDLNTLGLTGCEELSIYQGGTATFYGSGNIGGAFLIQNTPKNQNEAEFYSGVSSYGQHTFALNLNYKLKSWVFSSNTAETRGANNFPYYKFDFNESRKDKMENAFSSRFIQRNMLVYNKNNIGFRTVVEGTKNLRFPGFTTTGPAQGNLHDKSFRLLTEGNYRFKKNSFNLRLARINDFLRYDESVSGIDDTSKSITRHAQAEWVYNTGKWKTLLGSDLQLISANTEAYFQPVKRFYPAQLAAVTYIGKGWNFNGNGRIEWYEKIPVFGLGIQRKFKNIGINLSGSTSFRRPAFNDLFWAREDNTELKPERGKMAELGILWKPKFKSGALDIKATVFNRKLENPIIWIYSSGKWVAVNLYQGRYWGFQLSSGGKKTLNKKQSLGMNLNLDFVKSKMKWEPDSREMQRIFIPSFSGQGSIYFETVHSKLVLNNLYTGKRFTTSDNSDFLSGYFIINVTYEYKSIFKSNGVNSDIYIQCMNIFNADYQVIPGRPMPLRGVEAGLKIKLNK